MLNVARKTEGYRLLDVKVVRCASELHRFSWHVLEESDGRRLVGSSSQSYSTDADALRAGNAAARAIRRAGLS